jgi:predicted transcriptional regulator of viral defense system
MNHTNEQPEVVIHSTHIECCITIMDIFHNRKEVDHFGGMDAMINELARVTTRKNSAVRSAIRELIRLGFISRTKERYQIEFENYDLAMSQLNGFRAPKQGIDQLIDLLPVNKILNREEINNIYYQLSVPEIDQLMHKLERQGFIAKLIASGERGKYIARKNPESSAFMANPINTVNGYFNIEVVYCYLTALEIHGLSRYGLSNNIYIFNPSIKENKELANISVKAVSLSAGESGIVNIKYGNDSVKVTDIERTLIDCIRKPMYAVGWENVLYALKKVEKVDEYKILNYLKALKQPLLNAKVGFVMKSLLNDKGMSNKTLSQIKLILPRSPVRFFRNQSGKFNPEWNLYVPDDIFND